MKKLLTCFLVTLLMACNNTPADTTPPTTPDGFKATPGNATIKLEWTANTESDLEKYTLHWGSSAAEQNAVETIVSPKTSVDLTGLTNGTTYFFKLEAVDIKGNTSSSTSLKSAMPTAPDTTAPTLISSIPALNTSAVALNTQVQLSFSKAMNISTLTVSSNNLSLGAATWSAGNTVVSFVTPALQNDTTYTILIASKDLAGNNLGGATTLQFSSVAAAPILTSSTPISNAINVPITSKISLHFSKPMNKTSLETAFSSIPAIACAWVWTDSDQTATCTPTANLTFGTKYDLSVSSSAKSAAGVALVNPFVTNFTTVQDTVKPALVSFTPLDTATNVLYNSAIVLNFSKAMNQTSVQNAFQSQPSIACNWTWTTPSSASCQPSARLDQFSAYKITIASDAIDLVGNSLQAAYGLSFTTGNAPPKIISVTPQNNSMNVAINTPIVITFNEQMDRVATDVVFKVFVGTTQKIGSIQWNPECIATLTFSLNCTQLTFTPSTPYSFLSVVTWKVGADATDSSFVAVEAEIVGGFQTPFVFGGF